jgi:hypothetical protein
MNSYQLSAVSYQLFTYLGVSYWPHGITEIQADG